jgi:glutaconate CoA-transferase subunit A
MTMAHAARTTLATVEGIVPESLLADDVSAAGTIPALYVSAVAPVREGAWPVGLRGVYPPDLEHLRLYAELASSEAGFERYLERFVLQPAAAK